MILPNQESSIRNTVAHSVVVAANDLKVKAIVVSTLSGKIARRISTLRPQTVIIAACTKPDVARSLALSYGVMAKVVPVLDSADDISANAVDVSCQMLNLVKGDKVVITGGSPLGKSTNFLKIEEI